jgi:cell wall-associated NlpC family hydrolase
VSKIVQQARTYLGVKWKHRGRKPDALDCGGLPIRAYADLGVVLPDLERYGRDPFNDGLVRGITEALGAPVWVGSKGACTVALLQVGDIVVMAPEKQPRHIGIIGDDPMYGLSLIHADGTPGIGRVIEQGMEADTLGKIVAVFRRPVE